jgi:hypothetical protein
MHPQHADTIKIYLLKGFRQTVTPLNQYFYNEFVPKTRNSSSSQEISNSSKTTDKLRK